MGVVKTEKEQPYLNDRYTDVLAMLTLACVWSWPGLGTALSSLEKDTGSARTNRLGRWSAAGGYGSACRDGLGSILQLAQF